MERINRNESERNEGPKKREQINRMHSFDGRFRETRNPSQKHEIAHKIQGLSRSKENDLYERLF